MEVNELTASVKDYALRTAAIEQVSPVPMRFDEIEGDAKGYSDADKEICIQVGMGESQTIKTMIHEVAHAMLHNSDLMEQSGEEKTGSRKKPKPSNPLLRYARLWALIHPITLFRMWQAGPAARR